MLGFGSNALLNRECDGSVVDSLERPFGLMFPYSHDVLQYKKVLLGLSPLSSRRSRYEDICQEGSRHASTSLPRSSRIRHWH